MKKWFLALFMVVATLAFSQSVSFVLLDLADGSIQTRGSQCYERTSPCSTFKIALSLMGYDSQLLEDENHPVIPYNGAPAFLESWKEDQTPQSWINFSVIWVSRVLTHNLGEERLQEYVRLFDYGNQDISGGIYDAWLGNSSLTISPFEQVHFLQKIVKNELPITAKATEMTKNLLFSHTTSTGWNLYGKTGSDWHVSSDTTLWDLAWYVGWISKNDKIYTFALLMKDSDHFPTKSERQDLVLKYFKECT